MFIPQLPQLPEDFPIMPTEHFQRAYELAEDYYYDYEPFVGQLMYSVAVYFMALSIFTAICAVLGLAFLHISRIFDAAACVYRLAGRDADAECPLALLDFEEKRTEAFAASPGQGLKSCPCLIGECDQCAFERAGSRLVADEKGDLRRRTSFGLV